MGWGGWIRRRLDVVLRKESVEDELDDEIRFHLEMETRQHLASGLSPDEARRRALVAFGGVERHKEAVRDVRGARFVDDFFQDVRVAARSLPKQPAFLLTVLLTLAIGIGGNVAMFGVLDASLLQALPFPDAENLVLGRVTYQGQVGNTVSAPDYFDYKEEVQGFSGLSALTPFPIQTTVTGIGEAQRVVAPLVSPDLFRTLGVDPILGRHFRDEEGEPGGGGVVMIGHDFWQASLGGDPEVVGSTLRVDGSPLTVVGIMPPGFHFLTDADLWRPMIRGGPFAGARQFHNWVLVGRVAPGTSLSALQAEVDVVSRRLEQAYPDSNQDKGLAVTPLRDALVENYRATLTLLAAAVAVLLLVAGSNVAGLLIARGATRGAEMAVRSVMGAGRGRLGRQLVAENALLALAAAILGVGLALWLERAILAFVPLQALGPLQAGLSPRMLAAALALSVFTLVAFGVFPALRVAASDPAGALRSGTRTAGSRSSTRARSVLVVTQVALTTVLLVVSGLLVRSLSEMRGVDPGFETERLVTARVALPAGEYREPGRRETFFSELQERSAQAAGAQAAGLISHMPFRETGGNVRVAPPEAWGGGGVFGSLAYQRVVTPATFDALGIPLLQGRDIEPSDDDGSTEVVVLSESLAEALFPDGSALGRVVGVDVGSAEPTLYEVVGVVGDVIPTNVAEGSAFSMYFSLAQRSPTTMTLAVRSAGDPSELVPALRRILGDLDPDVPLSDVRTMEEVMDLSVSGQRAITVLLAGFGAMALILAAVGLYGVLAFQVSRRRHEIGVRMALGASASSVSRDVLGDGVRLAGVGLLLGVPGAFAATRLVRGMLYEVGEGDPLTYVAVILFLVVIAGAACVIPARRAAKVDPVRAFQSG